MHIVRVARKQQTKQLNNPNCKHYHEHNNFLQTFRMSGNRFGPKHWRASCRSPFRNQIHSWLLIFPFMILLLLLHRFPFLPRFTAQKKDSPCGTAQTVNFAYQKQFWTFISWHPYLRIVLGSKKMKKTKKQFTSYIF
jgi:hypothetical protein